MPRRSRVPGSRYVVCFLVLASLIVILFLGGVEPQAHAKRGLPALVVITDTTSGLPKKNPSWSKDLPPLCDKRGDIIAYQKTIDIDPSATESKVSHIAIVKFSTLSISASRHVLTFDESDPNPDLSDTAGRRDPQVSNDGNWIVYTKDDSNGVSQIWRVSTDTTSTPNSEIQITSSSGDKRNPRWNPGENTAIYERDVNGETRLYKICMTCAPYTTATEVEMTSGSVDTNPRWNRTGTYAVFERELDNSDFFRSIYVVINSGSFATTQVASKTGSGSDKNDDRNPVWFDDDPNVPAVDALDSLIVFERRIGNPPQSADSDLYSVAWAPTDDVPTNAPVSPTELLASSGVDHERPQVSLADPDKILYVRDDSNGSPPPGAQLYRYAIADNVNTLVVDATVAVGVLSERATNFVVQKELSGVSELYILDE